MNDVERLESLKAILDKNLSWVAAADSKIPPILAIDTAMLGVLAALRPTNGQWEALAAIFAAIAALLLLASIATLVVATFPRLSGPRGSLIFFGGIAAQSIDAYSNKIISSTEENLQKDYANQIHRNAEIANEKFKSVKAAMVSLFLSIVPWIVTIFFLA